MNTHNTVFDMSEIGKRISNYRKQKNLTQMEIADRLNISFQAVSSWERGETMPDITKLPELAQILEVTIDNILDAPNQTQIIEKINEGNIQDISKDENIGLDDIIQTAPLLKPLQLNELLKGDDYIVDSIEELSGIAPYVSKEILEKLAEKADKVDSIEELSGIAPFVGREILEKLAQKATKMDSIDELSGIAPFISKEVLDKIIINLKSVHKAG